MNVDTLLARHAIEPVGCALRVARPPMVGGEYQPRARNAAGADAEAVGDQSTG